MEYMQFIQGCWGSAFSILLKRLYANGNNDETQDEEVESAENSEDEHMDKSDDEGIEHDEEGPSGAAKHNVEGNSAIETLNTGASFVSTFTKTPRTFL